MKTCPDCQALVDDPATSCPRCGVQLPHQQGVLCPGCGAQAGPDDYFCVQCGTVLISCAVIDNSFWSSDDAYVVNPVDRPGEGPHLSVTSTGAVLFLPRAGDVILGREDPISETYPDINLGSFEAEKYGVSRLHARLFLEEGRAFLEDLDSLNSTFVNRHRLSPHSRYELHDGDEIQLASFTLVFHTG